MVTAPDSTTMTFFFTTDAVRATDHSQTPSWSKPGVSVSQPVKGWTWAKPAKK